MYVKYCKLSEENQLRLMRYFVAGTPAITAAESVGVHRNSATRFFHKLRYIIAVKQQQESEQFCGKIGSDESCFDGVIKERRRRGVAGKIAVVGLLMRGGKIYTKILDSEFKYLRINRLELSISKQTHASSINAFWNQSKRHMEKFCGIDSKHFNLFLKECEWRFNTAGPGSKKLLWPLKLLMKKSGVTVSRKGFCTRCPKYAICRRPCKLVRAGLRRIEIPKRKERAEVLYEHHMAEELNQRFQRNISGVEQNSAKD